MAARPPAPAAWRRPTSRCSTSSRLPASRPGWWARDGLVVTSALHPQLVRAASAAAAAEPDLGAHVRRRPRGTAAAVARAGGWPAIAVGVGDPEAGTRFAAALVRALDDELAALRRRRILSAVRGARRGLHARSVTFVAESALLTHDLTGASRR